VALAIVDAFAKFKKRGFTPKRSRDPDHAHFWGIFFTFGVSLGVVDPLGTFKQRNLIYWIPEILKCP